MMRNISRDSNHTAFMGSDCQRYILFEPVVERILDFISSPKEQCALRTINKTFDVVVKRKVFFGPILADYTLQTALDLQWDHRVKEIRVRDLQIELPLIDNRGFDCGFRHDTVTSLSFYPGVSLKNKIVLLNSFCQLQELRFVGSSSFPTCLSWDKFQLLQRLDIFADGLNDNSSLVQFLENAKLPSVTEIFLDLYIRTDFTLYFAAHNLVGNHAATLRNISLKFCAKHYTVLPESVPGQLLMSNTPLVRRIQELIGTFGRMKLDSLSVDFLPYEGTSLFYLSFALAKSQSSLKYVRFRKEYTYSRPELLPLATVILQNHSTLQEASIPHPYHLDCNLLRKCVHLKSLSIGEKSHHTFQMMFAESNVLSIDILPLQIQKFTCSIRLRREQVQWIVKNLKLAEFHFYGNQVDKYTLEDIQFILNSQQRLLYFGCNVSMHNEEYCKTGGYLGSVQSITVVDLVYGEEEFYVALGDSRVKMALYIIYS